MACCGQGARTASMPVTPSGPPATIGLPHPPPPTARMEYTGARALSAVGPVTGTRYRFGGPGARVAVDRRDLAGLATIPWLRVV